MNDNHQTADSEALPYLIEAVYLACTVHGEDPDEAFQVRHDSWERAVLVLSVMEAL